MNERVIGFKEAKKPFVIMVILLVVSALLGGYGIRYAVNSGALQMEDILEAIHSFMKNVGIDAGTTPFVMFIKIFLNNIRVAFIALFIGLIPYAMLPSVIVLANGFFLGAAYTVFTHILGMGKGFFMAAILPHGIAEMLTFCFSAAVGILLSIELGRIIRKKSHTTVRDYSLRVVKTFILVILPLVLGCALIETYITPLVLRLTF